MVKHPILHDYPDNKLFCGAKDFCDMNKQYSRYFSVLKDKPIRLIEFGILEGASIRTWEKYFPLAEIWGIDGANLPFVPKSFSRAKMILGNLNEPEFREQIIQETGGNFDIVLDDANHTMEQQKTLFQAFFPVVKDGGVYIIEDLYTSYWPQFKGEYGNPGTTVEYLKNLADGLNYQTYRYDERSKSPNVAAFERQATYLEENIYSIHFYRNTCLIFKGGY